jgi:phosphopantetheinyl transferase (holo-ACP synthase)
MIGRRDRATRIGEAARIGARSASAAEPGEVDVATSVGHALVYLPEFAHQLGPDFLREFFAPAEIDAQRDAYDPVRTFGVRWAAKKAASKAFCALAAELHVPSMGLGHPRAYEIRFSPGELVPAIGLQGRPKAVVAELALAGTAPRIALGATYERDYASAFVVIVRLRDDAPPSLRSLRAHERSLPE